VFYSTPALLAMQTAVIDTSCLSVLLSVCPSVFPSVTFLCLVQTNEDTIMRFSASDKKIILVSGEEKFIRIFTEKSPKAARALK